MTVAATTDAHPPAPSAVKEENLYILGYILNYFYMAFFCSMPGQFPALRSLVASKDLTSAPPTPILTTRQAAAACAAACFTTHPNF